MSAGARLATFLAVVLAVWTAEHLYVGWRLLGLPLLTGRTARTVLVAFLAAGWASYPLGRTWWHLSRSEAGRAAEWAGAAWMGVLLLLVVALAVVDLATLGGRLLPRVTPALRTLAVAAAVVAAAVALSQGMHLPRVTRYEVALPGLAEELEGFRIVQLSDLHLGSLLGRGFLDRIAALVEQLEPDLIAVTGDLVDADAEPFGDLRPMLGKLRAPRGVVAVPGNHEYYAGIGRFRRLVRDLGWELLEDRCVVPVSGLRVAGVADRRGAAQTNAGGGDLAAALSACPEPAGVTVLLAHSPERGLVDAAARGGVDLVLSGHTHGGQLWPFHLLVRLAYPYLAGKFRIGRTSLVVSRGVGRWGPPMRLAAPAEIVVVTLRRR